MAPATAYARPAGARQGLCATVTGTPASLCTQASDYDRIGQEIFARVRPDEQSNLPQMPELPAAASMLASGLIFTLLFANRRGIIPAILRSVTLGRSGFFAISGLVCGSVLRDDDSRSENRHSAQMSLPGRNELACGYAGLLYRIGAAAQRALHKGLQSCVYAMHLTRRFSTPGRWADLKSVSCRAFIFSRCLHFSAVSNMCRRGYQYYILIQLARGPPVVT
jgi:hypothetical protein